MARTKATEEQRNEVRRTIQQAAREIYRESGAAGTSARAIAKRAGVSVGTIYTYFGNLQGLAESLWSGPVLQANARMEEIAAAEPDPLKRLEALLRAYADFALAQPDIFRGVFLHVRPLAEVDADRPPVREIVFPKLLIAAIEEGQAAGLMAAGDAEVMAQALWGGVHGALAIPHNMARFRFAEAEKIAETATHLLVKSIRA